MSKATDSKALPQKVTPNYIIISDGGDQASVSFSSLGDSKEEMNL